MKKLLLILLSIIFLFSSLTYAGSRIKIEDKSQEQTEPINQHKRTKGILLIAWSIYASYIGYRMLQGADYEEGDVKLVGGLFLTSSLPLFIWGIKLTF